MVNERFRLCVVAANQFGLESQEFFEARLYYYREARDRAREFLRHGPDARVESEANLLDKLIKEMVCQ
jgi:hypothetical protein